MPSDKTRFGLDETRIPEAWYNVMPDLKNPPAPPKAFAPDGTELGPDQIGERLASLFPMECLKQEMSAGPLDRHPRRGHRRLQDVPPLAAASRQAARARPRPARGRQDLLQVRGREPRRLAQAQHRHPAGVLQQAGGHHQDLDRDRRRPVGQRAVDRRCALRHRRRGLHGQGQLRAEAVPPHPHGDLRRHRARLADQPHRRRPPRAGHGSGLHRLARHRDLRGRRGRREEPRHALRAGLGAQPRVPAPDDHRPRGHRADGARRRRARRRHRLRRRRLATSPDSPSRTTTASSRARATRACSPSSPRPARRSPPASTATTSATRPA